LGWYSPKLKRLPKRLPRRRPIKAVPSGIGDKGIVGNWLFYYLKGGDHLHDFSPYDNHGTINGASWKDGRYGWALDFDGTDDYVKVPYNSIFDSHTLTITGWLNLDVVGSEGRYLDFFSASHYGWLFNSQDNNGNGTLQFITADSTSSYPSSSNTALQVGKWYHIAVTYDNGTVQFYLNGEKDGSDTIGDFVDVNGSLDLWIGANQQGGYFTDGRIPIVRVYSLVKSASWIKRRFERTRGIFGV